MYHFVVLWGFMLLFISKKTESFLRLFLSQAQYPPGYLNMRLPCNQWRLHVVALVHNLP